MTINLLEVNDLSVSLGVGSRRVEILHHVDLALLPGTTLGLVGESGSGKSTLAKTLVGIHRQDAGSIFFASRDITKPTPKERAGLRRRIQLIPQDPYSSLNPRRTVAQTIAEAIDPRRASYQQNRDRIHEIIGLVRLDEAALRRYPHEFSGGQRQRIAIGRALAVAPELIIADEITSALDLSTQAEILELLDDLRSRLKLSMIFVSHNLAVVRQVTDTVLVLLQGEVVEYGNTADVFKRPAAEYTRKLIESVPGGPGFSLD